MGENEGDRTTNKERENRILDAAADLLVHYGFDKTTVSDIAREAGVSKGAIYLHWKSKEDLLNALIWRDLWKFAEGWIAQIGQDEEVATFAAMYKHLLAALKTNHPLLMAVFTQDKRIISRSFLEKNAQFFSLRYTLGSEFFHYMQKEGVIRQDVDVNITAYILSMFAYGYIRVDEVIPPEIAPPIDAVVEEIGNVLDRLLTPEDGGNPEALRRIMRQLMVAYKSRIKELNIGG